MTLRPVCRVGDHATGTCRAIDGIDHPRQFLGTWVQGSGNVTADGIDVIREGDTGITDCNPPHHMVATGHGGEGQANGKYLHRVGDAVVITDPGGGEGVSTTGSGFVSSE